MALTIQCLSPYTQMCLQGCYEHSFIFLFAACASLSFPRQGKMLRSRFVKSGFEFDAFALTTLVDMYAKLGFLALARQQFNEMKIKHVSDLFAAMPSRNVITWTTIISGYSQNGRCGNFLAMFLEMEKERGARLNEVTIASVLPACANLGALKAGHRIEGYATANGYLKNVFVCNAILEMYARCVRIDTAKQIFDKIGIKRNLCSWNTMIMGLAVHGKCDEALELFH